MEKLENNFILISSLNPYSLHKEQGAAASFSSYEEREFKREIFKFFMQELNLQDILAKTQDLKEKRVGYVAIIGRPNAGKSTFINTLLGEKIAITSPIPQTTRNQILAIYNDQDSQIIFIDTPGIHESEKIFNAQINHQALTSLRDAEVVLYFIDSSRKSGDEEKYIANILEKIATPVLKIYTKIDLPSLIEIPVGENMFQISSVTQDGIQELLEKIKSYLPLAQLLFPEDFTTKQSLYFRISEIIREKFFEVLKQELPHSIFIQVEEVEDTENGLRKIVAYVYTETDSQKYIVIGKNGSLIAQVGTAARKELEELFGQKVFLSLRAKVKKDWRKDENFIKKMLK